eukprot:15444604-Alexandrium_andersonii.AAC.1
MDTVSMDARNATPTQELHQHAEHSASELCTRLVCMRTRAQHSARQWHHLRRAHALRGTSALQCTNGHREHGRAQCDSDAGIVPTRRA